MDSILDFVANIGFAFLVAAFVSMVFFVMAGIRQESIDAYMSKQSVTRLIASIIMAIATVTLQAIVLTNMASLENLNWYGTSLVLGVAGYFTVFNSGFQFEGYEERVANSFWEIRLGNYFMPKLKRLKKDFKHSNFVAW